MDGRTDEQTEIKRYTPLLESVDVKTQALLTYFPLNKNKILEMCTIISTNKATLINICKPGGKQDKYLCIFYISPK